LIGSPPPGFSLTQLSHAGSPRDRRLLSAKDYILKALPQRCSDFMSSSIKREGKLPFRNLKGPFQRNLHPRAAESSKCYIPPPGLYYSILDFAKAI